MTEEEGVGTDGHLKPLLFFVRHPPFPESRESSPRLEELLVYMFTPLLLLQHTIGVVPRINGGVGRKKEGRHLASRVRFHGRRTVVINFSFFHHTIGDPVDILLKFLGGLGQLNSLLSHSIQFQ